MKNEDKITAMITGGAVLCAAVTIGYYAVALTTDEGAPACSQTASQIYQMNLLSSSGDPMSVIELQSELGGSALGIMNNTRVIKETGVPDNVALEVALSSLGRPGKTFTRASSGAVYAWNPNAVATAEHICLRYALKVPADFDPGDGGLLPGIYGGSRLPVKKKSDGTSGFAIRTLWRDDGRLVLYAQVPENNVSGPGMIGNKKFAFDKGRWVWIDQEIELNTPGQNDGVFRFWIDNKMAYEHKNVAWRTENLGITGIIGDVYYGSPSRGVMAPPSNTAVRISSFQISVQ